MPSCVVAGAGGFIGGHLVADLVARGAAVRAVDAMSRDSWYQVSPDAENLVADLTERDACRRAVVRRAVGTRGGPQANGRRGHAPHDRLPRVGERT